MVVENRPAQRAPRPEMSPMREDCYTSSIEAQPDHQSYVTKVRCDILKYTYPGSRSLHAPTSQLPCPAHRLPLSQGASVAAANPCPQFTYADFISRFPYLLMAQIPQGT